MLLAGCIGVNKSVHQSVLYAYDTLLVESAQSPGTFTEHYDTVKIEASVTYRFGKGDLKYKIINK